MFIVLKEHVFGKTLYAQFSLSETSWCNLADLDMVKEPHLIGLKSVQAQVAGVGNLISAKGYLDIYNIVCRPKLST